jgi:hypothetical protein
LSCLTKFRYVYFFQKFHQLENKCLFYKLREENAETIIRVQEGNVILKLVEIVQIIFSVLFVKVFDMFIFFSRTQQLEKCIFCELGERMLE